MALKTARASVTDHCKPMRLQTREMRYLSCAETLGVLLELPILKMNQTNLLTAVFRGTSMSKWKAGDFICKISALDTLSIARHILGGIPILELRRISLYESVQDSEVMGKRGFSLSQGLNRDIYPVVCKLLDDSDRPARAVSVFHVYDAIQRTNSSLKRKPKALLEKSIENVLEALQDEESDSEAFQDNTATKSDTADISNAINRSIAKSMTPKNAKINGIDRTHIGADAQALRYPQISATGTTDGIQSTTNEDRSKKRSQQHQHPERPNKRSKAPKDGPLTAPPTHVSLADLGGMDHVIEDFKEHLMLPLKRPERYLRRGLKIPRGMCRLQTSEGCAPLG